MMKRFNYFSHYGIIMIMLIGFSFEISAQKISTQKLDLMFNDYTIVNIDSRNLHQTSRNNHFFEIDIPKQRDNEFWKVELHNSGLISDDYISQYTSESGVQTVNGTSIIPTKGHVVGRLNTTVSLTFSENFVYGFIKDKTGYNYIEPLYYYDKNQRGKDLYVVYNAQDLKPSAPYSCGTTEAQRIGKEISGQSNNSSGTRLDECYEVDYAIANDFLMFQEFGSVFATEEHAIGVTNNVQANYDDEFADELQLIIVTQYTATSNATDPWTSSTAAGTLLNDFRNWGPSGFAAVHDVGSLWTDRNFDGPTVGIAYLGVICTGSRYNCLMNFTNNSNTKRMMVAHELGHNFNASHDASGSNTIMAPAVNTATTWSSASINSINNHVASRWCLSDCAGSSGPPSASFTYNVIEECTPGLVQFTNASTGSGTLSYEWDFPGGTPSFSTNENPFVTYDNAGSFNVTLTVTNTSGSDEETQNGIINITPSAVPDFSYNTDGTVVSFFNISQNATSYFWDFGDGSTSSDPDPVHDYLDDGVYTVELTASSICGDVTVQEIIVIANPPTADFDADVQEGCAPLTVQFTSNSSNNTDDFIWTFEGGNPAVSSEENPMVTYSEAGSFDVTLTVVNETGDDILSFTDYIEVNDVPVADFSYVVNDSEVTFTNFSTGGDTYLWDFGDGNSSMDENPVHTYGSDGDYDVILTVTNDCGENSVNSMISISLEPIASFEAVQEPSDCATFVIEFENTSTNDPETFEWTFEGGDPATSNEENPTITYADGGQFDVTLTVTNSNGTNTMTMPDYVTVFVDPIAAFTYSENGLGMVMFNNGSIDADSYAWDFGDGNTSSEESPTHEYEVEGIYTVELVVTNQCGTHSSSEIINTYTPVEANFSSTATQGCANFIVEFEDASSENVTEWLWTFEGGTPATSTEQNPSVSYNGAGQYDVILTVSHPESSETITLVNYVAVTDVPVTSFEYFDDILDVDFNNTTLEGNSYMWDFGDGNTSTEESPSHTYTTEGEYEVVLTATNECGTTISSQTLMVNALPTAGIDAESPSGCGPLMVQFNDASSSNVTAWAWTFEGGNPATSSEENPVVEYASAGTYQVQLVVTAPAGTDMIVIDDLVEVLASPTAAIDYDLDGNVITANNTGSAGSEISWSVDGNAIDMDELVYTFPENGTYQVELITENNCGTDTEMVEIEVNVYPEAYLDDFPITVCVGDEVQLIDNSINAEEKAWTMNGANPATSNEDNPIVTYDSEGVYSISLMVSNQYGDESKDFVDVVNVIGLPSVTFTGVQANNVVDFTVDGSGVTYFWDFGDGTTSTEQNPSHTFETNGEFEVILTVSNACGESQVSETFTINSNSVTEAELANVKIYPNPAQTNLNIELSNNESDQIMMDVLDISGKLIKSVNFNVSSYTLDVSDLLAGTYLIRLRSEQASYYKKVAVIK